MSNELNKNNSVIGRANEAISSEEARGRNKKSETGIMLGLALSSLFTIIYMVVALGGSLDTIGWPAVAAYAIGALLGLAAIMPGEAGLWIWKTKLQSDQNINDTQVIVAWVAGLVAAISAAISTVSFFAYLLQGLMPQWYDPNTAAGINVANIAISWAVFGICVFVYTASGNEAERNRERAKAAGLLLKAENDMIKGIAGAIQARINQTVDNLDAADEFYDDAMENIARMMGLDGERLERMQRSGRGHQDALPAPPDGSETLKPRKQFGLWRKGHIISESDNIDDLRSNPAYDFDSYIVDRNGAVVANPELAARPAPAQSKNGSGNGSGSKAPFV